MADDLTNVAEEIQQEGVVQPNEDQNIESPQTQNSQAIEGDKEYNFKQLREGKKQLEEEVKRLRNEVESLSDLKSQSSSQSQDEESLEIGSDDLVEGRHLKKLASRIEKMMYEKEIAQIPDRLKNRFSDFDEVVSVENVEKLKQTEPELYRSITASKDLFAKGVSAYKTLKALGIYQPKESYTQQKEQVQSNRNKPMSVQSIKGQGALHEANAFANGLTDDLKKQLQKEMEEAIKAR